MASRLIYPVGFFYLFFLSLFQELARKPHSNNHSATHACNCGQKQGVRNDPFTLKVGFALVGHVDIIQLDYNHTQSTLLLVTPMLFGLHLTRLP